MFFDGQIQNHLYTRRVMASLIDISIEAVGGLLGGYFGAMIAALVIALKDFSGSSTQKAIWFGMICGFIFWGTATSWLNRVLVQGVSRASFGKKIFNLEIVSTGTPISWRSMNQYWISFSMVSEFKIVSSLDQSQLAPVISINSKPAVAEKSADKKAA